MNGQTTIVAKKMTNIMGSDHLTDIDVKRIRKLYCRERTPPPLSTIIGGFKFQQGNGKMMLSNACYFHGRDIGRKKSSKAEDCADYCARTPKCSHFTWNQYHGSDCCLKAGLVPNARPHTAEWDYVCGYKRNSVRFLILIFLLCNHFICQLKKNPLTYFRGVKAPGYKENKEFGGIYLPISDGQTQQYLTKNLMPIQIQSEFSTHKIFA